VIKLKIGKIPYTNLFPIFYMLEQKSDCTRYEFIEGVPSELNNMIRSGDLDVSPSSSIEYLRQPELYELIENHSVSSFGTVGSILLFSRVTIEALDGLTILTTSQSETSCVLLEIILRKFYAISCPMESTSEPLEKGMKSHNAYMLIGDEALNESLKWPELHVYDLGELWHYHTGLPFTFALWFARKNTGKPDLIEQFKKDLQTAKDAANNNIELIASQSPLSKLLSEEALVSYWKGISYDFGDEHKKGLELFKKYAEQIGIL
jgi:chorismate dehydratase